MNGISSVTIWLAAFRLSVCCNARSAAHGARARTLTRQAEVGKRGRNWQPTDGRLQGAVK